VKKPFKGSHRVELFNQTPEHIVNQKTHPGGTPCENHMCQKVLIAHAPVNVPHRTLGTQTR
jgi:hypothetical protein